MLQVAFFLCFGLITGATAQKEEGYSREQLQPLTQFRFVFYRIFRA